jgi:hypothetical protein
MKNPDRNTVSELTELPNIGKATAYDLHAIGINHPQDLIGQTPVLMYEKLCKKSGGRLDPCVLDVFMSVVSFMEGDKPRPWWFFTPERKKLLSSGHDKRTTNKKTAWVKGADIEFGEM